MHHDDGILTDRARISALRETGLLDSLPEQPFDGIARLAGLLLEAPMTLVTLVDADRQFFKSAVGLGESFPAERQTPLTHSLCKHVVLTGDVFTVEDARDHPMVRENGAVVDLGVVAYAGAPITTEGGHRLGSLAAADSQPRQWSRRDIEVLRELAALVVNEIDARIQAARAARLAESALAREAAARETLSAELVERRRAEWSLREVEAQFRQLVENLPQALWLAELGGRNVFVSPAFEEVWGRTAAEVEADPELILSDIHPDDRDRVIPVFLDMRRGGEREVEFRLRRPDGTERWVVSRSRAVRTPGAPLRIAGVTEDITDRKAAELERERLLSALQDSEARYRRLFDLNPQPMWVFDRETLHFLAVNDAAVHQYGWSRDEMLGMTIRDIRREDDVPQLLESLQRAPSGFQPARVWRHRRRDGSLIWVEISTYPLRFHGRSAELVLAHDVTDTVNAHQQLLVSEERYRRFFEDDLTGDYIARADGSIVECNNAFARIFGFDGAAQARNTNLRELFPDPALRTAMLDELQRRHRLELFEATLRRRDGQPVDVIGNLVGSFDEHGQLTEIKGYLFDITERKALEAQLAQAQKMEVVGRLAGGIAHDFNNMLTAIIGHAQLLLEDPAADDATRAGLMEIERAADRSAQLTRQLLAFSRRQVLMPQPVDLNRTIAGMEGMLRRLIGEHIAISTLLEPDLPSIYVDPGQLNQVLLNLVLNARDAMPRGGRLVIRTEPMSLDDESAAARDGQLEPGEYAILFVQDNGHGMDADTTARIFEPFFTTKPVGHGTGLGLATVYGIVKQSRGEVLVSSDVGRGTSFTVILPLAPTDRPDSPAPPHDGKAAPAGSGTILLVEDDPGVRRLAHDALQAVGYTVLDAASGDQAIQIASHHAHSINLVLSDVVMPGLSGQEAAVRLREIMPGVPILFMSGYSDDLIGQHGELETGSHFIEKPFTPDALRRRIGEIILHMKE